MLLCFPELFCICQSNTFSNIVAQEATSKTPGIPLQMTVPIAN